MRQHPKIYDEAADPDPFWEEDYFDSYLPEEKGFITDFVYALRGTEIPTLFAVWSAIFAMSSAVKREAWLKWGVLGNLYMNLYILLVGPAGCKKSATVNFCYDVMKGFKDYTEDINFKIIKDLNIVKNKATPEAVLDRMIPKKAGGGRHPMVKPNGNELLNQYGDPVYYYYGSEVSLMLSELAVMMGKQNYSESMIENLMDLYDPMDTWEWSTIRRGTVTLKKLYTTLLGATTPTGFRESVPSAAMGDGFLSRTILAYAPETTREFDEPADVPNGPTKEHLMECLAWISEATKGEYQFSPEARVYFKEWYHRFKEEFNADPKFQGVLSRKNINVQKVAFFMHAQRYAGQDHEIQLQDVKTAIALVDATYRSAPILLSDIETNGVHIKSRALEKYIEKQGKVTRQKVQRTKKIPAHDLTLLINHIANEGKIKIIHNGQRYETSRNRSAEIYIWDRSSRNARTIELEEVE